VGTVLSRAAAALVGVIIGGGLMCGIAYTHGTDMRFGAIAGAVLVGILGFGVAAGTMSRVTLSSVLFGLFFGMIGPGVDDYGGLTVVPGAMFGALVGYLLHFMGLATAESDWSANQDHMATRGVTDELLTRRSTRGFACRYHVSGDPVSILALRSTEAEAMRLPSMTTRRWMLVVTLTAFGLGIWVTARRRHAYQARADLARRKELKCKIEICVAALECLRRRDAAQGSGCIGTIPEDVDLMTVKLPVAAEGHRRSFDYHRRMRQKYELAARYPWLPVEPDPATPEP
jgi:hypothetical protein